MRTQDIPRDQWNSFFDSFSLKHQGWLVTVEVVGPVFDPQVEAREMPLQGITADLKGNGEDLISIILGTPKKHLTHRIHAPTRVFVEQNEDGADEALEVESVSEARTFVRFRSAMLPELVDGII